MTKTYPQPKCTTTILRDWLRFGRQGVKLGKAMRAEFGAEHIDLSHVQFTPELLRSIPIELVRRFRVLPVSQSQTQVCIAMADPSDLNAVDSLAHFCNRIVHISVADQDQIAGFIQCLYESSSS